MNEMILFDMDGTLLDSVPVIAKCCNLALRENNLPEHDPKSYVNMVGWGMQRLMELSAPEGSSPDCLAALSASYDRIYSEACHTPGEIYPGIPEMLLELKARGIRTAVLSNKPEKQLQALYESTFQGLLDVVWGHREGYGHKPDPTLALELVETMNGRLLAYVGDSEVDLALGKNLGVPTIGVTWGTKTREQILEADPSATLADTPVELERQLLKLCEIFMP